MPETDPRVDEYIAKAAPFAQPILTKVRAAFHAGCPSVVETIKWSVPSFEHKGMLGGMAAFKKHVSYGFWKADVMEDPDGLFVGDCKAGPMMMKVHDVKDLPTKKVITSYVRQARKLNDAGVKRPKEKRGRKDPSSIQAPPVLAAALKANKAAQKTWDGFNYSCRKDYAEWVTSAKREATRDTRVTTAVEWMAEGKKRHWKYEDC